MARRSEDATVWIGYADFLTTLALLFLVLTVVTAGKIPTNRSGFISGIVQDSASGHPLAGCSAVVGGGGVEKTQADGKFLVRVDSLSKVARTDVTIRCRRYATYAEFVRVGADDTTHLTVRLHPSTTTEWEIITLPGDALFATLQYDLKDEGIQLLRSAGMKLKENLRPGDMIVVQGHTDDLPIPKSYRKDNWMLSGERAAAAVKVLTDSIYGVMIPKCQVATMGFGPSRPRDGQKMTWAPTESEADRARKRALNRRIELRRVSGIDLISGSCVL